MEFAYYYKTSDGVRTRWTMKARNKEQVFGALRERGIKAIKVERTGWRFPVWSLLLAAAAVGAAVATGAWYFGRPVPQPARRGGRAQARRGGAEGRSSDAVGVRQGHR